MDAPLQAGTGLRSGGAQIVLSDVAKAAERDSAVQTTRRSGGEGHRQSCHNSGGGFPPIEVLVQ